MLCDVDPWRSGVCGATVQRLGLCLLMSLEKHFHVGAKVRLRSFSCVVYMLRSDGVSVNDGRS